jgi:homoserine dehydrogenase
VSLLNSLNLCLVGFGNASKEFCRILIEKDEYLKSTIGYDIKVTAICTQSKGILINHEGLNLGSALKELSESSTFSKNNPYLVNLDTVNAIKASNADVMIELSTLSIKDGQPAITHIETAFDCNMHVITANKGPIAWDYKRLFSMSKKKNLTFLHETTVMDGTPVFNLVKYALPGCKVLGFKGILNTTTNFILEEMENGRDYEESIKEAQRRGFAEADPSLDIDGWDAAAKTAALANVLMDAQISPREIEVKGISNITLKDVLDAKKSNKKIKLISETFISNGNVISKVYPCFFDLGNIFSTVDLTSSMLSITTDLMGEICIIEKDPEIRQTAYGIYSDLLNLIRGM